jgi:hypothetical protein
MPSLVSYNICGLSKLEYNSNSREWLLGHDIVALQETLHLPHSLGFEGFTVVDEPARVQVGNGPGRRSGGIALLFSNEWLGSAKLEILLRDWYLLAVKVWFSEVHSVLIVNVYVPLHCTDCPPHIDAVIRSRIETLLTQYASDKVILCGDWNGDLFCLNSGFDRKFLKIDAAFRDAGFSRYPIRRQPYTFRQKARRSTIDYIYHRGVTVTNEAVARIFLTNHRPIRITFASSAVNADLQLDPALGRAYPRSPRSLDSIESSIRELSLMKVINMWNSEASSDKI